MLRILEGIRDGKLVVVCSSSAEDALERVLDTARMVHDSYTDLSLLSIDSGDGTRVRWQRERVRVEHVCCVERA